MCKKGKQAEPSYLGSVPYRLLLYEVQTLELVIYFFCFGICSFFFLSWWEQKTHLLPADGMNATH
jgi:hypothetical protein